MTNNIKIYYIVANTQNHSEFIKVCDKWYMNQYKEFKELLEIYYPRVKVLCASNEQFKGETKALANDYYYKLRIRTRRDI